MQLQIWLLCTVFVMPPPLIGGALSDAFVCLSVCLSRTSDLCRKQRPRKTKIGREIAHVTHDSDTAFKVKRSLYSPRP